MRSKRRFLSERGLILEYGNRIDPVVFGRVRLMAAAIQDQQVSGVLNLVPTYRSLLVEYDPLIVSLERLNTLIDALEEGFSDGKPPEGRFFELPTYYGKPYDFDTDRIAEHNGITPKDVVRIFSETTLLVYFIGFIAALPYIGDLPECLHTPRLQSPRVRLPAGVVGVGGQQVAYPPVELPSGFNYIGRCFYKVYDPDRFPPTPFRAGDRVRFKSVSQEEAESLYGIFPEPTGKCISDNGKMSDTFHILNPGVLTTVQDLGRIGYGQFGIAVSGAMDRSSLYTANLLVGNDPGAAGLEITLYGLKMTVLRTVQVAISGADMQPTLDGKPVPMWETVELPAGSTLLFKKIGKGARSYLAFRGGLDAPVRLGSRSTQQKAMLGKPIRKGDRLRTLPATPHSTFLRMPEELIPKYLKTAEIRVIMGPQDDAFTKKGIDSFLSETYTITHQSDRQGYRLEGPLIEHLSVADIISDPILPGSIQVPGNGQPIIMMVDAQTTGGYCKIACVIRPDIDVLAQMLPGRKVHFKKLTIAKAHDILRSQEKRFFNLCNAMIPC